MNKDTIIRTGKTFIQAFAGNLIPAIVTACKSVPESWSEVGGWIMTQILTPQVIIGTCLATAICAVWNASLQKTGKQ